MFSFAIDLKISIIKQKFKKPFVKLLFNNLSLFYLLYPSSTQGRKYIHGSLTHTIYTRSIANEFSKHKQTISLDSIFINLAHFIELQTI